MCVRERMAARAAPGCSLSSPSPGMDEWGGHPCSGRLLRVHLGPLQAAWCMMQRREGVSADDPGDVRRAWPCRGSTWARGLVYAGCVGWHLEPPLFRRPSLTWRGARHPAPPRGPGQCRQPSRAQGGLHQVPQEVPCGLRPEVRVLRAACVVSRGHFAGTLSWVGFPCVPIRPVLPDGVEWEEVLPAP